MKFITKKRKNVRYLFGCIECDTVVTGDYSKYGKIHTIQNILRAGTILLIASPIVDVWIKMLCVIANGIVLDFDEEKQEISFKIW